mgnify:FL=1
MPDAPTLGNHVSAAEIDTRWANLQTWYASQGHFWLGTGPFYLESADYVTKNVVLNRFAQFPDPADKWDCFVQAPSLTLNFDTGAPGSYFTVTGENFPPLNVAHISVNSVELSQAETDIHGGFTVVLSTEAGAAEGYYDVVATVNPEASTFYILDVVEEVRPLESAAPVIPVPEDVPSLQKLFLSLIYR